MRAPETDARAKPLITSPTCRTGICSTVMNTRNCVSSPIVMWPCMTREPPYRNAQHQQRGGHERRLRLCGRRAARGLRAGQQPQGLIDGLAEVKRNEQLKHARGDDGQDRSRKAHAIAQRHAQYAPQRAHAALIVAVERGHQRVGTMYRRLNCGAGHRVGRWR